LFLSFLFLPLLLARFDKPLLASNGIHLYVVLATNPLRLRVSGQPRDPQDTGWAIARSLFLYKHIYIYIYISPRIRVRRPEEARSPRPPTWEGTRNLLPTH
jgi:hypothetical protein